jgi:hypothetical protein
MSDIATLGIAIDTRGAQRARGDLDAVTKSAQGAAKATEDLGSRSKSAGTAADNYARRIQAAYEMQEKLTRAQVATIRGLEDQIVKTQLSGRELAVYTALRKAGTNADSEAGRVISRLATAQHELSEGQRKATDSGTSLANVLTRRLIFGAIANEARHLTAQLFEMASAIATVADAAKRAGVSGQTFQGLQAAAGFAGMSAAEFQKGIQGFAAEFNSALKSANDLSRVFTLNGQSLRDQAGHARSLDEALFTAADLVKNARTEQDKLAIAQQLGLPATREWLKLLEQGGEGIRRQMQIARSSVGDLSDEALHKAEELDRKWNEFTTNAGRFFKSGFMFGVENWSKFIDVLSRAVDLVSGAERAPTKITVTPLPGPAGGSRPTVDPADVQKANDLYIRRVSLLGEIATVQEQVRAKELEINNAGLQGVSITKAQKAALLERTRVMAEASKLENQIAFDRAQILRSPTDQGIATTLRSNGIAEGSERAKAISDYMRMTATLREMKDAGQDFANTFVQGLMRGQSLMSSLSAAFEQLASKLASSAITDLISGDVVGAANKGPAAVRPALFGSRQDAANDNEKGVEYERNQRDRAA